MANGKPQFERQVQIAAVANRRNRLWQFESTALLAPATYQRLQIFSPPSTVSKVYNMAIVWETDASESATGKKYIVVDMRLTDTTGIGILKFEGNCGTQVGYDQGGLQGATAFTPSDIVSFNDQVGRIRFDDVIPLQIAFRHTDIGRNYFSPRKYYIFAEEESVSRD